MFNRILVLFLAVVALGSNAFASRATTSVMGTGDGGMILNGGSLYYDDAYNIFYNAAYVNDYKNWAIIEKANGNTAGAEGGVFSSFGQFNLGLFFNRGNAIVNTVTGAIPGGSNALSLDNSAYGGAGAFTPVRPVELYVGTDVGAAKIGLGLTYARGESAASTSVGPPVTTIAGGTSNYLMANLGAEIMGFDPFVTGTITSKDSQTNAQHKFYRVGARYHWGEWTPYVAATWVMNPISTAVTVNNNSISTSSETNFVAGFGRTTKLTDSVRLMYGISYIHSADSAGGFSNVRHIVPIDVSTEADALSWLTVRAGLGYRLIDQYAGGLADSTANVLGGADGRFGATAHMGKVDFEMAAGSSSAAENVDGSTFSFADGLFSEANLTYHF